MFILSLCKKIKRKIFWLKELAYFKRQKDTLDALIHSKPMKNRIYLFCAPTHSNLGDQAQLMCWLKLFSEWYPDFDVVQVPTRYRSINTLRTIHKFIQRDDILFIHSGYLFFDPHPELPFILDIVRDFYDHKITILPQTVNFIDEWCQHIVSQVLNSNPNVTLICRDEVSFSKAREFFPNINLTLMPDVVTSLIGMKSPLLDSLNNQKREGILFCLRNDLEKHYTNDEIDKLKLRLSGIKMETTDTTINTSPWEWESKREELINRMLMKFAKYELIITDRYHGTIFSQIVNTPVIVINSTDHKLSSGVKWFPQNEFHANMHYADNLEDVYQTALEILKRKGEITKNPPYFKETFFKLPLNKVSINGDVSNV